MSFRITTIARAFFAMTILGAMLLSVTAFAEPVPTAPSVRILAFPSNDPWQAVQTVLHPTGGGHYRTEDIGGLFRQSNKVCESLLSEYQARPLKVMLDNKYITQDLYDQLSDPAGRAHDMRQYLLVTLFEDMPGKVAAQRGFGPERFLDEPKSENGGERLVRVHMGSMFAVLGFQLERSGHDSFRLIPLKVPFEIGKLPATLANPLERENLPAVVELGRALVEKGSARGEFSLLMQVLTGALAAQARALHLSPAAIPIFGHALDPAHVRLFSQVLRGKPMTPAMQRQLEADPASALDRFSKMPMPGRDDWANFSDSVVTGSLAQLIAQYPEDKISQSLERFKKKFPTASGPEALRMFRELQFFNREDFDFTWHDPHRPGQRAPVQIRDWGTGLLEVRVARLLKKYGFSSSPKDVEEIFEYIEIENLNGDPDFGQADWLERSVYVGVPKGFNPQSGERLPSLTISNLDPDVPQKYAYLAKILLAYTWRLQAELKSLDASEERMVLKEMNEVRRKKALPPYTAVNLQTFLETYDLNVGTANPALQNELKVLGADLRDGLRIDNPFKGGHMDVQIDPAKLGLDLQELMGNPEKYKDKIQASLMSAMMNGLSAVFKPCRVLRFGWAEIEEMREEFPDLNSPGTAGFLAPSYHRQKLERFYSSFQ